MRYISNPSGKLENVVQAMAEEICSIAFTTTATPVRIQTLSMTSQE
jgi:hypothetical protein